jgi:ribosomal protein S18 acetylase RimI-like enzyme
MVIRTANISDIDFIIEAIVGADKSGTEVLSYCRIFDISINDLLNALRLIIEENLGGFEISLDSFKIAEIEDKPVGAVASWIEGANGVSSGIRKLSAFSFVFPRNRMELSKENLSTVSHLTIDRTEGALQIESVYTHPSYRGKGIAGKLITSHLDDRKHANPGLELAQIQVMKENQSAVNAYLKMGFEIVASKTSDIAGITLLLPGKTKLMLEKKLDRQ